MVHLLQLTKAKGEHAIEVKYLDTPTSVNLENEVDIMTADSLSQNKVIYEVYKVGDG